MATSQGKSNTFMHISSKTTLNLSVGILITKTFTRSFTKTKFPLCFLNVETALRIYLSLMITNCSGERSFSRLKHIKNELRRTMLQGKLSALSIMCIESDKLRQLSFNDLIEEFAHQKVRKKKFLSHV